MPTRPSGQPAKPPAAGYSGTPLPKKLGIKDGFTVVLAGAPEGFEETLGTLPPAVTIRRGNRGRRDLTLWFVSSVRVLERGMEAMATAAGAALWICWPKKASGMRTDVTEAMVRGAGLAAGLVDYKICAVDATWSGLKFARRRGAARAAR